MLTHLQPDLHSRHLLRKLAAFPLFALVLFADPSRLSAQVLSPEQVLEKSGLERLGTSTIWTTPSERQLREALAPIASLKAALETRSQELSNRIDGNNGIRAAIEQLNAQIKAAKGELQKRLKRKKEALEKSYVDPKQLGNEPDVRAGLIDLIVQRDKLLVVVQAVREHEKQMRDDYTLLEADPRIAPALAALGQGSRLGPAKDYASELEALPECDRLVLTDYVPMFLQGNLQRVSGIVDDRFPITFTWEPSGARVLIPYSMAELAGLDISQGESVEIPEHKVRATRIELSSLRFGGHLLRDVEAFVLPPAGEYLGARIGPKAFKGLKVAPQPEQLKLLIQERK
jgi:hypothetical protein